MGELETKGEKGPHLSRERLESFAREGSGGLYTLFRRSLRDPEAASDLLQETLMEAWKSLASYDAARPFRNWIFRIGQNRLRNHLRRRRLERRTVGVLEEGAAPGGPSPAARLLSLERQELLEAALLSLPERQRLAVLLRYQEGFSCEEIGGMLEMSPNAVSIQLHHARKALRKVLGQKLVGENG